MGAERGAAALKAAIDRHGHSEPWSNVISVFANCAAVHGSRIAAECDGVAADYAELDLRSNRFAHRLIDAGVRPGDVVGTLTARSIETLIAFLAILKCGAAYLPLDPQMPQATMQRVVDEARPKLVLRASSLPAVVQGTAVHVLEDELAASADAPAVQPAIAIDGGSLAYIMYTSGSTGQPKGALVPHRAILRLVLQPDYVSLTPETVMLHAAPLAFDASTFEIWGALLNGGRLVVVPDAVPSLDRLGRVIKDGGVTTLWLTAGLFHLMVESRLEDLKGVEQLLAGGDVLSPTHVRRALEALEGCVLINGYGPTENTTFTCCYPVPRQGWGDGSLPIGFPIRGTRVHILDDALQPVPPGADGQLAAGGAGVALGYCARPDLTAERFVADPFSPDPEARLYLTGDIVRQRPDGAIEFRGRRDRQVKISGFRIELDEIENSLRDCGEVDDAAVVLAKGPDDAKQIVAFLKSVEPEGSADLAAKVMAALRSRMPAYMLPHHLRVVRSFPLNVNGKVDRNALLADFAAETVGAGGSIQAGASGEGTLAAIALAWTELLGRGEVDVTRNLFELGATSLLIVRAHERVQRAIGRTFPITDMFSHPTIAALATHLERSPPSIRACDAQDRAARQRAMLQQRQPVRPAQRA